MTPFSVFLLSLIAISQVSLGSKITPRNVGLSLISRSVLSKDVSDDVTSNKQTKCEKQVLDFVAASLKDAVAIGDLNKLLVSFTEKWKAEVKTSREEYVHLAELTGESIGQILADRFDLLDIDRNNELDETDTKKLIYLTFYFDLLGAGVDKDNDYVISKEEYNQFVKDNFPQNAATYEEFFTNLDTSGNDKLDFDDILIFC